MCNWRWKSWQVEIFYVDIDSSYILNEIRRTSLCRTFRHGEWRDATYVPAVEENIIIEREVMNNGDKMVCTLDLWDTPGQEEFDRLRCLMYRDTHIMLICFALDNIDSYQSISSKWIPEVDYHAPDALKILVGLKSDIKDNSLWVDTHLLVYGYIHQLRYKNIHILDDIINIIFSYFSSMNGTIFGGDDMEYMEVSSLKNVNVQEVFERALIELFEPEPIVDPGSNCFCTML